MPELPEVETMCHGVACIVGSRVDDVECAASELRPIQILPSAAFRNRVRRRTIVSVGRVGKRVVLGLDSGVRIVQAQRSTFYCPRCQKRPRS